MRPCHSTVMSVVYAYAWRGGWNRGEDFFQIRADDPFSAGQQLHCKCAILSSLLNQTQQMNPECCQQGLQETTLLHRMLYLEHSAVNTQQSKHQIDGKPNHKHHDQASQELAAPLHWTLSIMILITITVMHLFCWKEHYCTCILTPPPKVPRPLATT